MTQSPLLRRTLLAALATAGILACGGKDTAPAASTKISDRVVLGYYGSSAPVVFQSVATFTDYLSEVSIGGIGYNDSGVLTGSVTNSELIKFDEPNHINTYLCIANVGGGDFNADLGHSALVTHAATLPDLFVGATLAGGYQGFNLDFEGLYPADRAALTAFVHDLSTRLHAQGLKLILSTPAVTLDDPEDDWAGAYDFAPLGVDADYLQVMTYDENGPDWSDPGPVAGADWAEACLAYTATVVDPAKILIGLPAYGYDWDLTAYAETGSYAGTYVEWISFSTWLSQPGAVVGWDDAAQTPYVNYTLDGHSHQAWYENPESIKAKTAIVKKYNLGGLSVWALGQEDLSFWEAAMDGLE